MIQLSGRVQGVGFRYYAQKLGNTLALFGYVRNLPDGSLVIEAEGNHLNMDLFIERIKRGPQLAHVEQIQIQVSECQHDLPNFEVQF
jgi:acylphosphatase